MLGDLRLVKKIAAGGMAEVWEARKTGVEGFEKRVAVKVILPHLNENDEFIRMFLDEGRLAARLDHPNICQIIGLGEADGTYYMSMEFIDGIGLSALMKAASKRGVFVPFEHCCQLIIGACAGLDYAHSCTDNNGMPLNLVHRDISPQNIMITYNGGVKVVDFGIAKAASQVHHTRAGVLKGKYAYMSPEQATGKPLDRRSDVFALGIVLWELTTGNRLFRADNEIATLHKIIGGDYPPPSTYRDGYPPALELIVQKALATEREHRFQDCGEMQLALEDFLLRHGLAAGSKRLSHYVQRVMSDGEITALPTSSSLVSFHSQAFETGSNSGVHTPSNATAHPVALTGAAPTHQMPVQSSAIADFNEFEESSHRNKRRSNAGLWLFLLVLLLGGGAIATYALMNQKDTDIPVFAVPWTILSTPHNASIHINDELRGQTPKAVMFAPGKRYIISIRAKGYLSSVREIQKFTKSMAEKPLRVTLRKKPKRMVMGRVLVKVRPTKANVLVNGKPLRMLFEGVYEGSVAAGVSHTLTIKSKGHKDHSEVFLINVAQKKKNFNIELKRVRRRRRRRRIRRHSRRRPPPRRRIRDNDPLIVRKKVRNIVPEGWISIITDPPGAVIKLNGSTVGSSPMKRYKLTAGVHRLSITKAGYAPVDKSFRLTGSEFQRMTVKFVPLETKRKAFAVVSFGGSPTSRVFIDGKSLGKIPLFKKKLSVGTHTVVYRTVRFGARFRRRVKFKKGHRIFRHKFPMGKIWLLSRPTAKVYLNGDYVGRSMRPPYTVPAGSYSVRFVFPNGSRKVKRVRIRPGQKKRVVAKQ